jgi:hypothetical protein
MSSFSFLILLTYISIGTYYCLCFCVQLDACIGAKLSSLSSLLSFTSAKILISLAISQLLYLLLGWNLENVRRHNLLHAMWLRRFQLAMLLGVGLPHS